MTIFEEILSVAKAGNGGMDQLPHQSDQEYLLSLVRCIRSCPDEQWESLSKNPEDTKEDPSKLKPEAYAQDWVNYSIRAINGMKEIPYPPGFKEAKQPAPPPPPAPVQPVAPPPPVKVVEDKKEVQIPAIKNVSQIGEVKDKVKREKNVGVLNAIRRTVIEHLDWSAKQVYQYLSENGYPSIKPDIVAVNAGDIRRVCAVVKELNHWKD